jgi:hypothetical protein
MNDFNLKKFLIENKMTRNSILLSENIDQDKLKEYHEFLLDMGGYDLAGDFKEMLSYANSFDSFEDFIGEEIKTLDDPETIELIKSRYLTK